MRTLNVNILFFSMAILPSFCLAQSAPILPQDNNNRWIITLGTSTNIGPSYEGARSASLADRPYHLNFIPSISWRRENEKAEFSAPDDSWDLTLFSAPKFRTGFVANVRSGRYHSSDIQLKGLHNVKWTLETGAFAEYWPVEDHLRLRTELRHGIFRSNTGFISDISGDWVQKISKFTLSGGPRVSLANTRFMNRNFAISENEALQNSRVSAFIPAGGLKSTGFATALSYDWNNHLSTSIFQRYDRLTNDAAKSPVTSILGQRNQYLIGANLNYSFKVGL
jgi:MipA family protein